MLSFDTNHSFIDNDLNKKRGKKTLKNIVIGSLIVTNIFTFSACSKDMGCGIEDVHAHLYTNEENIGRYIVSEKEHIANLSRQDNYITISENDKELLDFLNDNDLYKIEDNLSAINSITTNFKDHMEYKYEHLYTKPVISDE